MLRKRLLQVLEDAFLLAWALFLLALVHGVRALGVEWPFLETGSFWAFAAEPVLSAVVALVSLGVMAVLFFGSYALGWRRLVAASLLALATLALYRQVPQVSGLWGLQVLHLLISSVRERSRRKKAAAEPSAGVTGPSAGDALTLAAALVGVLLAVGITFAIAHASSGLVLPLVSPADRLPYSHRPLAAAVVTLAPGHDGERALVPHPTLTREQVLTGVREQGGGWSAGRVLELLERRKQLGQLPPMDPARVAALLGPAEAADVLLTAEGQPASAQGLWGVVVEAEHWTGERRALLSLGLGEPSGLPATRYEFLLGWPGLGGTPRVIAATRFVARSGGLEGVEWPGVFLPVLLVCLLSMLGLRLGWGSRGKDGGAHVSSPSGAPQG